MMPAGPARACTGKSSAIRRGKSRIGRTIWLSVTKGTGEGEWCTSSLQTSSFGTWKERLCSTENQTVPSSICNLLKTATLKKWQCYILNSSCLEIPWSQMNKRHPRVSKNINHSLPSQVSLLIYTAGTCAQNLLLLYYIKHCNLLQETFWCLSFRTFRNVQSATK